MKKNLYALLVVSLILGSVFYVKAVENPYFINNYDIEMTDEEYHNLLNLGFTEDQIARMDEDTFNSNKDIVGEVVAEKNMYVKTTTVMQNGIRHTYNQVLTQEEMEQDMLVQNQQIQPTYGLNTSGSFYDGLSGTEYRYFSTHIVSISDSEMRFKVDVKWLEMPSTRSYDILGIGFEAAKIHMSSNVYFREDWRRTNGDFEYDLSCYPKMESTGGSALYELPSYSIQQLEAYIYFNVAKNANVGTITELLALGDSKHAYSSVNPTGVFANYTVNSIAGIDIDSPYDNAYDTLIHADAHFYGTW